MFTSRKAIVLAAYAVAFFAMPAAAQSPAGLWVEGTSTVRSFRCEAKQVESGIKLPAGASAIEAARAGDVSSGELTALVSALDCGNGTMNDHMRKALKADEHKNITFNLNSYELQAGDKVVAQGTLTIAGQSKPVSLEGVVSAEGEGLRIKGSTAFKMSEFGVRPPSLMMGTMKVGDAVKIGYDLKLPTK